MTNERLEQHAKDLVEYALELGRKKGAEYAQMQMDNEDRFRNFRIASEVAMMDNAGQSMMNYLMKSFMSIGRFVKFSGKVEMNESLDDRFADLLNYTFMLYGWIKEELDEQ